MKMKKKVVKKVPPKRGKYDERLAVTGSFIDIMKAAASHANTHSATGKNEKKRVKD